MLKVVEFRIPADEYRTMPVPSNGAISKAKLATCFVRVEDVPQELEDWMSINPRTPRRNTKGALAGVVAHQIVETLREHPEKFAFKNQGIYLIVKDTEFVKEKGGQGVVTLQLTDPSQHGLINGGHTFFAIREVTEDGEYPNPWDAYVRLHILAMEDVDSYLIADIAEGLNRSLQVDNTSIENLQGSFDEIKRSLEGKQGSDQIAYKMGDSGEFDIEQILTYMNLLNLELFPDRKNHPHTIFGKPKAVLDTFIKDVKEKDSCVFKRLVPHLDDILILIDRIQQLAAPKFPGKLKVSNTKKNNRVRSPKNKERKAHFAGGLINGHLHLGWLYPMVAAFRANISRAAWEQGELDWLVNPEELLKATIDEMAGIVLKENEDNKGKPAEVGRKEAAYRGCYSVIVMELAQRGILTS
ncbi:MAG: AIPR family protein [Nostoc sp.]|uniref:AIPR family protein n=1 Tax=Nostoc sp. TaxID=1180 RepID=UPI002FF54A02